MTIEMKGLTSGEKGVARVLDWHGAWGVAYNGV